MYYGIPSKRIIASSAKTHSHKYSHLPLALNPIQWQTCRYEYFSGVDTSFPGFRHVRFRCRYFSVSSHENSSQNVTYGMVYFIYIYLHTTSICNENILNIRRTCKMCAGRRNTDISDTFWYIDLKFLVVHKMSNYTLHYLVRP